MSLRFRYVLTHDEISLIIIIAKIFIYAYLLCQGRHHRVQKRALGLLESSMVMSLLLIWVLGEGLSTRPKRFRQVLPLLPPSPLLNL